MIVDDPVVTGSGLWETAEPILLGCNGAKAPSPRRAFVEIPLPLGPASCCTWLGSFARGFGALPTLTDPRLLVFLLGSGGGFAMMVGAEGGGRKGRGMGTGAGGEGGTRAGDER
jgi:hypothetical protein